MTLRGSMARLRLFAAFFLALLGLGIVLHGAANGALLLGASIGAIGFSSLFLIWLSVRVGENEG
jgi:hypothetical protein